MSTEDLSLFQDLRQDCFLFNSSGGLPSLSGWAMSSETTLLNSYPKMDNYENLPSGFSSEPLPNVGSPPDYFPVSWSSSSSPAVTVSPDQAPSTVPAVARSTSRRRLFTGQQLTLLEHRFRQSDTIEQKEREDLAAQLNLTATQVKTWFVNRRNRFKSQERKISRGKSKSRKRIGKKGKTSKAVCVTPSQSLQRAMSSDTSQTSPIAHSQSTNSASKLHGLLSLPIGSSCSEEHMRTYRRDGFQSGQSWQSFGESGRRHQHQLKADRNNDSKFPVFLATPTFFTDDQYYGFSSLSTDSCTGMAELYNLYHDHSPLGFPELEELDGMSPAWDSPNPFRYTTGYLQ